MWKVRRGNLCGMANLSIDLPLLETPKFQEQNTRTSPAMLKLVKKLSAYDRHVWQIKQCLQILSQLLKWGLFILPPAAAALTLLSGYHCDRSPFSFLLS